MKKNIVLIGFMGSGKSTLAQILAQKTFRKVVSTDDLIQKQEGRSIADIFQKSGESVFRVLEHHVVLQVAQDQELIIDCGGGVVLNPQNMTALKKTGVLIYLSCQPKEILRRIQMQPKRPLLDVADPLAKIEELLHQRKSLYDQADLTIDTTDGDLQKAAQEIITKVLS